MDQRYYNQQGSFWTPGMKTADPTSPGTWGRYAYGSGDPINRADPAGMADCLLSSDGCPALATGDGDPSQTTCNPGDTFNYYNSLPTGAGLAGPVSIPGCVFVAVPLAKQRLPLECEANLYTRPINYWPA